MDVPDLKKKIEFLARALVQGQRRPFPLNKLEIVMRVFRGEWKRKRITCDFTKVESLRHSSHVNLKMCFYTAECINPASRDKVEALRETRGKVLTLELCNGAEFSILRGLVIQDGEQESNTNEL